MPWNGEGQGAEPHFGGHLGPAIPLELADYDPLFGFKTNFKTNCPVLISLPRPLTATCCVRVPSFSCQSFSVYVPGWQIVQFETAIFSRDRKKGMFEYRQVALHPRMQITFHRNRNLLRCECVFNGGAGRLSFVPQSTPLMVGSFDEMPCGFPGTGKLELSQRSESTVISSSFSGQRK